MLDTPIAAATPSTIAALDTPCVTIDLDAVERNLQRCQAYADKYGLALRPHIKTHKIPHFAHRQLALGARGITCQKIGEAEVMADAGITDILITYNLIGGAKMGRLVALARRTQLKVVADSEAVVDALSQAIGGAGLSLEVMVECDTGAHRCGVAKPEDAARLGVRIAKSPGLKFRGLMTFPAPGGVAATSAWLGQALSACKKAGVAVEVVSTGGTPDLYRAHEVAGVTEFRPGTYIYNDRSLVERKACAWDDCALRVQTTVVSKPAADRCVVDAGSKTLSSDTLGLEGFGHVIEYPHLSIKGLSEEHGVVAIPAGKPGPEIGERVTIVPNHACPVSNLHDRVYGVRGTRVETVFEIAARGRTQ